MVRLCSSVEAAASIDTEGWTIRLFYRAFALYHDQVQIAPDFLRCSRSYQYKQYQMPLVIDPLYFHSVYMHITRTKKGGGGGGGCTHVDLTQVNHVHPSCYSTGGHNF